MAVVFTQTPTTPNGSQSTIIYGVNNLVNAPQAKYVCDIYEEGNSTKLVRIKQPANNSGYGVFEISDILHDYMEYDEIWTTDSITNTSNNNTKTFSIEFGEEFGTSLTSALYVSASQITDELTIYPAVTDPIDGFNWDSGSYYSKFLSNSPSTLYTRPSDYGTLSKMNITGANVSGYTIIVYDSAGSILASKSFTNSYGTSNADDKIIHLPFGPKNFENDGTLNILSGDTWSYYTVITSPNRGSKTVYRLDDCIEENGTQFAFINRLGVFDYYTATLTKTEQENYTQDTYEQTFVDFSTTDGTIPFNSGRRGTSIYNKKIDSTLSAQTDWLNQEQADWLVELFQSPSVYVKYNDGFIPVIITNSTVDKKTNPRGQKLFTYRIEYKFANPRKSRR